MPYNTTAIPPRQEATGSTQLPLSRVRKMIMQDTDISVCANSAAFVITLATEMFIQYMAEQGHNIAKAEKKPRRNIQYRDLSSAVEKVDNLEFLADIVPKTVPFKEIKNKKAGPSKPTANGSGETGQTTLDGTKLPVMNGTAPNGYMHAASIIDDVDDPNAQLELESREQARINSASAGLNGRASGPDIEMS